MPADKRRTKPMQASSRGIVAQAAEAAKAQGLLPHEFLLKVMRGEGIEQKHWEIRRDRNGNEVDRELKSTVVYAPFGERVDAAKAAAPYYAARLATQIVAVGSMSNNGEDAFANAGLDLGGLDPRELATVKKILMDATVRGLRHGPHTKGGE